ncbi:AraC family transcriptional regulator [Enterococcus florum]|uniref:AraC family transcriptional regulator n=1 Tax=Enterococcus florum TaxID=2480627 RepID=A0A4V0WPM6_9ENTE|nr:helix-turn-helix domain-containing protein [Enterococcus florum]GCF94389.1 AraC family transcriptional regulator [Enterococcus florum]
MVYFKEAHYEAFYQFLASLDCYLQDDQAMQKEVQAFQTNVKREIAAFVTLQAKGAIEIPTGYTRIIYLLDGEAIVEVDGTARKYEAGHLFLVNPPTSVRYEVSDRETAIVTFYFKAGYFSDSLLTQFSEERELYRFFVEAVREEFHQISRYRIYCCPATSDIHVYSLLLLKQIVKMCYFNNKVTKAAFVLLIVEIAQLHEHALIQKDDYVAKNQLIEEVLAYLDLHIQTITLEKAAAYFHFHPNYLSARLKEKTGRTFTEILMEKRIVLAQDYLVHTELPIHEIVEYLGYRDKAFFYKKFKKSTGMTPRQYRLLNKKGAV